MPTPIAAVPAIAQGLPLWLATPLIYSAFTPPAVPILAAITGLCLGSFANVMGLRQLKEEEFVKTPSHCPVCKTPLSWWENLPVLSYVLLGGKCRHCKTSISLQYPLIELLTAVLFALTAAVFGWSWGTLFLLFLVFNLVVIIITDLKESLIFHANSLSLVPVGLLYNALGADNGLTAWTHLPAIPLWGGLSLSPAFTSALVGVLGAFALFEGMILLSRLVFGTDGFGHGDTFLLMGVAAFLGVEQAVLVFLVGIVLQALLAYPLLVGQWVKAKNYTLAGMAMGCLVLALLPYGIGLVPAFKGTLGLLVTLGCSLGAVGLLLVFLRKIKTAGQFSYMPLGPALVAATLLALFFGPGFLAQVIKW